MITKRVEFGSIEILPNGVVQLREDTVIEEDGVELSRKYHRTVLEPDVKVEHPDERVAAVATLVWTPDVVATYKQAKEAQLAEIRKLATVDAEAVDLIRS